jgi:site-specific DNA-methyltransferase (adenine-specific)
VTQLSLDFDGVESMSLVPAHSEEFATIFHGDCIQVMAELAEGSIDAIVCDPPYGLEFMGKEWDAIGRSVGPGGKRRETDRVIQERDGNNWQPGSAYGTHAKNPRCMHCGKLRFDHDHRRCQCATPLFHARASEYGVAMQEWYQSWASQALRVLKPGGHLVAFGGTRTFHRLTCALEDAGFEIRDCLSWLYGSGFPKSLDVSKAIDKAAGAERVYRDDPRWTERYPNGPGGGEASPMVRQAARKSDGPLQTSAPVTPAANKWAGWGTALKPAWEPIILARKPLGERNVAANVLAHGTGAINVDGCRVGLMTPEEIARSGQSTVGMFGFGRIDWKREGREPLGRWPANLVLDDAAAALLDEQSGESVSAGGRSGKVDKDGAVYQGGWTRSVKGDPGYGDVGGASRFFYTAKADAEDRDGSKHPTVKPVDLMKWLIRLVTPPGGVVLDPFLGSGTTVYAARALGIRSIGIEREAAYVEQAIWRLRQAVLL